MTEWLLFPGGEVSYLKEKIFNYRYLTHLLKIHMCIIYIYRFGEVKKLHEIHSLFPLGAVNSAVKSAHYNFLPGQ